MYSCTTVEEHPVVVAISDEIEGAVDGHKAYGRRESWFTGEELAELDDACVIDELFVDVPSAKHSVAEWLWKHMPWHFVGSDEYESSFVDAFTTAHLKRLSSVGFLV